ncbi:hypothetical protein B0H14DRAFT_2368928, partial [Mycena olivaceomarginata]
PPAQIKKNFTEVHVNRNLSGFGWDKGLKLVTATQDVWNHLLAAHPDYTCWQTTPFLLYDNMLFLVDGIITTGAGTFHAGAPMHPTPSAHISASAPELDHHLAEHHCLPELHRHLAELPVYQHLPAVSVHQHAHPPHTPSHQNTVCYKVLLTSSV